jgi:hypothetical protein
MFYIVLGRQAGVQPQIATSLGAADWTAKEVTQVFRDRYGELVKRPTGETIRTTFAALRGKMVHSDAGLQRWVACLALVRT